MRLVLLSALLAVASASAQPSSWSFPPSDATVSLSAERPLFDGDTFLGDEFGPITSAWRFETSQPIGPLVRIVGEIPFAFASLDVPVTAPGPEVGEVSFETRRGAALGNVQLGAEVDLLVAPLTVGGYVRLPTVMASDDTGSVAQFVGSVAADEQVGAFITNVATVSLMVEGRPSVVTVPGLSFRLRATPQLLIPTADDTLDDSVEGLLGYTAQVFFSSGVARVGGGLAGVSILTDDDDRHRVSVGVLADAGLGPVRVGAVARLPIAGMLTDQADATVGLSLDVPIR